MATEPLWTEEDIATLKAAVRSGVLTVSYDGPPRRTVQYQSLSEMRSLLAEMVGQVRGTTIYRRVAYSKGFERGE